MAERHEIDQVLERTDLAQLVEEETGEPRRADGKWLCPFHEEKSGSFGVARKQGRQFAKCFGCGWGGDSIAFLRELHGLSFGDALERLARRAGVTLTTTWGRGERGTGPGRSSRRRPAAPAPRPAPPPPERLPQAAVARCWAACQPVTETPDVASWLRGRGLDPALVEELQLARALPADGRGRVLEVPGKEEGMLRDAARFKAGEDLYLNWRESGHRLILPLWDSAGRLAGLTARDVTARWPKRKSLFPAGQQSAGLAFACPAARQVLAGPEGARPCPFTGRVDPVDLGELCGRRLVLVEGGPDWLTWASRWGAGVELEGQPAVMGYWEGSWAQDLADRIPDGWRVALLYQAEDEKRAGTRMAARVATMLRGRCLVSVTCGARAG